MALRQKDVPMETSPNRRGGRQSDDIAEQTRQRIIASARAIFAARGFAGVSLRDIAAHAEVTLGLLRHHFGSKDDIWRAVIDATIGEYLGVLTPLLAAAEARETAALDTLKAASRNVVLIAARYPDFSRLLLHEGVEGGPRLDYFLEQIAPLRERIAPLVRSVQQAGGLPQFSHNTFLLALLMMGAMPFALVAFSNQLCALDILAPAQVEQHADRVIATLFCQPANLVS